MLLALLAGRRTALSWADRALCFALLLAGTGLLLVAGPEIAYVRDLFGNRMNTVFKFHYQAWLFLGLAGAFGVMAGLRRRRFVLVCGLGILLALAGVSYIAAAAYTENIRQPHSPLGLDALRELASRSPDEAAAIRWLRANTAAEAVIGEAAGKSYQSQYNRVSTFTGRSVLLGWLGHERQWRGANYGTMSAGRLDALRALYRPESAEQVKRLCAQWGIDYVYVGPGERGAYGVTPADEAMLDLALERVFTNATARIYLTCRK